MTGCYRPNSDFSATDGSKPEHTTSCGVVRDNMRQVTTDSELSLPLLKHQAEDLTKLLAIDAFRGGCLNLSEPGTGKTYTTLAMLSRIKAKRVLVIALKSLVPQWAEAIELAPSLPKGSPLTGPVPSRCKALKGDGVFVTNYEAISRMVDAINAWAPEVVVCDEATRLKSHRAQAPKAIKKIKTKHRWALTGTPIANSPLDAWGLLSWATPTLVHKAFSRFRDEYAIVYNGAGFPIIKGFRNLDKLKAIIDCVSVRHLKEECLDLPSQSYKTIHVDLSPDESKAYKQMANDMIVEFASQEVIEASTVLTKLGKLRQVTAGFMLNQEGSPVQIGDTKTKAVLDILEELEDQKVIIMCAFKEEVHRLSKMGTSHEPFILSADMGQDERDSQVKGFHQAKGPAKLVTTAQLGGIGLNLQCASHMIFASQTWSLEQRLQAEARIHRHGQHFPVTYYDVIAPGTIDEHMHQTVRKKLHYANYLTGDDVRKIIFNN